MGKNIGLIIFLVFVAIQVVMGIVQKISKEQQEQKMRQMAEERRKRYRTSGSGSESETAAIPTPAARPQPQPQSVAMRDASVKAGGQDRLDALAARRKQQLDELRRRRSQQVGSGRPGVQARTGPVPPTAAPVPIAAPLPRNRPETAPARLRTTEEIDPRVAEAKRRQREVDARKKASRDTAEGRMRRTDKQLRREAERAERTSAASGRRARTALDVGITEADAYAVRGGEGTGRARRIRALFSNSVSLRDLIVMREILEPPVGLRTKALGSGSR